MNSENISTADYHQQLIQARTIRNRCSTPPPLLFLPIHFGDDVRAQFLFLYSARFIKLAVQPLMILILVVPGCTVARWGTIPWFALIASSLLLYALVGVTCEQASRFFAMHVHLASFPRTLAWADSEKRRLWFSRVKRWFEVNGLAGSSSRRWIWNDAMRKKFDHIYSIITRRMNGVPLPPPANADQLSEEDLRTVQEIRTLLEELPVCQEFSFFERNDFAMLVNKTLEGLVLLWFTHALILTS